MAAALASSLVSVTAVESVTQVSAGPVPVCTLCGGGEFHPLGEPVRVFDTRATSERTPNSPINDVAPLGAKPLPLQSEATFDVQLLDLVSPVLDGVPTSADDVLAMVVSITAVSPTARGYLKVYPSGATPGQSSVVNFQTGRTVPNMAIVRPGTNGKVTIAAFGVTAGEVHVLVDVFGWFGTSSYDAGTPYDAGDATSQDDERGARLIATDPVRLLDTRPNAIGADDSRSIDIAAAVPADDRADLVAAVVNITGIKPTSGTFIAGVPFDPAVDGAPTTSNLNLAIDQVKATLAVVPVAPDGTIHIYNAVGSVNVAIDLVGYFVNGRDEATRAGRVVPLASPYRVLDTRDPAWGAVALGPGQAEVWSFANFASSVKVGGVAVGEQVGLLGNLTSANLTRQYPTVSVENGFLTVYPGASSLPLVSTLNASEGGAVPNMALVKFGPSQQVNVFNKRGYINYLLDVSAVILSDPTPV